MKDGSLDMKLKTVKGAIPQFLPMLAFAAMASSALAQFGPPEVIPQRRDCPASMSSRLRIECLLSQMTLSEKALFVSGAGFSSNGVSRLGIPPFRLSDGPKGVRTDGYPPTTAFPGGVSLASTWNPGLVEQAAMAMGREAKALGIAVLLGPGVNIQRYPLGGRSFEYYSEDPVLAGEIGVGWVKGLQSQGVAATPKHFAANSQETNRFWNDSVVDERALREIYLPQFERIVKKAKPWSIMAAYNRVNGTYASHDRWLLTDVLRKEWGFDGAVISDWTSLHDTSAGMNAGLDLEMPNTKYYGPLLRDAVENKQVEVATLDESVRRLLLLQLRTGSLDGELNVDTKSPVIGSQRHLDIARKVAAESIVLLKNESRLLPLRRDVRLAVIGPNADATTYQGSGSSEVSSTRRISVLDGLDAIRPGLKGIQVVSGVTNDERIPQAIPAMFRTEDGLQQGLTLRLFGSRDFSIPPLAVRHETSFAQPGPGNQNPDLKLPTRAKRWSGYFVAPRKGLYAFSGAGEGEMTMRIDHQVVLDTHSPGKPVEFFGQPTVSHQGTRELSAGRHVFEFDYVLPNAGQQAMSDIGLPPMFEFGVRTPVGSIQEAADAARNAEVAVVVVGLSMTAETEGSDKPDMELPGQQNNLIEAVLAANPNTVVVMNTGGPVRMPWADRAKAIVQAWYPGQEGGFAVADVLFGLVNPSGKLPMSFPKRLQDSPAWLFAGNTRTAFYGESIFIGYRYFDKRDLHPQFPFGHGLSYTSFAIGPILGPSKALTTEAMKFTMNVSNTGKQSGAEVVQLYVSPLHPSEPRPVRELKAFQKVYLQPGESGNVCFALTPRDFAYWSTATKGWLTEAGDYRVEIGTSSRDIRQSQVVHLNNPERGQELSDQAVALSCD